VLHGQFGVFQGRALDPRPDRETALVDFLRADTLPAVFAIRLWEVAGELDVHDGRACLPEAARSLFAVISPQLCEQLCDHHSAVLHARRAASSRELHPSDLAQLPGELHTAFCRHHLQQGGKLDVVLKHDDAACAKLAATAIPHVTGMRAATLQLGDVCEYREAFEEVQPDELYLAASLILDAVQGHPAAGMHSIHVVGCDSAVLRKDLFAGVFTASARTLCHLLCGG
jgi:hypothetical protein